MFLNLMMIHYIKGSLETEHFFHNDPTIQWRVHQQLTALSAELLYKGNTHFFAVSLEQYVGLILHTKKI